MSQIKTTGYVRVQSGQITQLDLSNFASIVSARIRWKGVIATLTDSATVSDTKTGGSIGLDVYTISPSVPSGWTFKNIVITNKVINISGDTIPELTAMQYLNGKDSYTTETDVYNGGLVSDSQTSINSNDAGKQNQHGAIAKVDGAMVSKNVQITGTAKTTYTKTGNTINPKVTVNGQSAQHVGTLSNGVESPWYNLTGLIAGQINNIYNSISGSGYADCEIEYIVIAPAVVKTNDATNVSYSTVTINGEVIVTNGEDPTRFFECGHTPEYGTVIDKGIGGVGVFSHDLTGLELGSLYYYRAYATNTEGTGYGTQKTFTTLYPYLVAPTRHSPDDALRTSERRPWIELTLTANVNNPATKYHARIRFSEYVNMSNPIVAESATDQDNWELWDGLQWIAFPAEGIDPGSKVRGKPAEDLPLETLYWDAAGSDGTRYGANTTTRSIRILLTVNGLYTLVINDVDYLAYDVVVKETANGQIGEIVFSVNNADGTNNTLINYGDEVKLGINDSLGNTDEFKGIVRSKAPAYYALTVTAITGSGILAERLVKVDYAEQDIGLTVKAIIDTYCQPLTSTNINTATGIVAPIQSKDKTPLSVFEDIRRQFGVFYYVDKDWDAHLYLPSAIGMAYTTVKAGEVDG